MSGNRNLRRVLPPGHVDAHCVVCHVDVILPEGTLRCPHGDHDVEPTSLPRMPVLNRTLAEVDAGTVGSAELAPAPTVMALQGERQPLAAPVPAPREPEPVVLPDTALAWHADTVRLNDQLVADEARLVEQLRRTRQTRKLLDVVLGRVMPPDRPAALVEDLIAEPTAVGTADSGPVAPTAPTEVVPTAPKATPASGAKLWAPKAGYAACINCGTSEIPHGHHGRCKLCASYFDRTGRERPLEVVRV